MDETFGYEELGRAVKYFNRCNTSFIMKFTSTQLLQLYQMALKSEYDIYADEWTDQQVKEALLGFPPNWDDEEIPVYHFKFLDLSNA